MPTAKPFLKWPGGKRRLLSTLQKNLPDSFDTYFEPFLGGGAMFFGLRHVPSILSDLNRDLIDCYRAVSLDPLRVRIAASSWSNTESDFKRVRSLNPKAWPLHVRAARLIFLNKTCFNGLFRVNQKGRFNTSFGRYKNPTIIDEENFQLCHEVLNRKVQMIHDTVWDVCPLVGPGDFVYMDPPYYPTSDTSFVSFTSDRFLEEEHVRLNREFYRLTDIGAKVMLSNSAAPWVREAYKRFTVIEVQDRRSISATTKGRSIVGELLIKNY